MHLKPLQSKRNIDTEHLSLMAGILRAIAHPIRLRVVELLEVENALSVSELLEFMGIEQSLLSHHLADLKKQQIVQAHRKGKNVYYSLRFREITKIFDCMEHCHILQDFPMPTETKSNK